MTAKKRSSGSVKKTVKKAARRAVKTAKVAKKEVKRSATTIVRAATNSKKKSSKKPVKKKTAASKSSVKKIYPNKRPAKSSSSPKKVAPAINLINQGANLLKKAVVKTEEGASEGRRVVKTQGLNLVDKTSEVLHSLITGTSHTVSDGLKKL
jgi:hypothetical protein